MVPLQTLIRPAVAHIAATYGAQGGAAPEAMMVAIGMQESRFEARDQLEVQDGRLVPGVIGPATGFWQFERGGGVMGVMRHPASRRAAQELTAAAGLLFEADAIWRSFATPDGDELAAAFARLLLLTDPQPLPPPTPESEEVAWTYYLRNWRPGIPHRNTWGRFWADACRMVASASPVVTSPSSPDRGLAERVARLEAAIAQLCAALRS